MNLTSDRYPYPSQRRLMLGKHYAIATSQPLAVLAGLEMFWEGGNAVDAAIAAAVALTVVEPTMNGVGGDGFAQIWDGRLQGLNGSGRSPHAWRFEEFAEYPKMPRFGWQTVTIPGLVAAWRSAWDRWGKLPFEQLFAPAIRYATEGFPVSPVTAAAWRLVEKAYLPLQAPEFSYFKTMFFPQGRAPRTGETWGSQDLANTLKEIANTGGESIYSGALAQRIVEFAATTGGKISVSDLQAHQSDWVTPISTRYRDVDVWELPPNTQGIAALLALNILEGFDLGGQRETVETYHRQIEAMKLAFADTRAHVSDPDFMRLRPERLLDHPYLCNRRNQIQPHAAPYVHPGFQAGGTVYLATADQNLMVSWIQSNYDGFGSGIAIPGTGIALHNRGAGFETSAAHPNAVAPNKRPFHTIIPGFLTQEDGQPLGPIGVMGAAMQPQGHVQMVTNLVDFGLNPQAALDAPRWRFIENTHVRLEKTVAPTLIQALRDRGHHIELSDPTWFGKGQIILRHQGSLLAASEPRSDGLAIAG
ncbi:MAG: gamma-glutamyltransferase family protein [Cyanobacteria bacterium P01_H01_bin.15]